MYTIRVPVAQDALGILALLGELWPDAEFDAAGGGLSHVRDMLSHMASRHDFYFNLVAVDGLRVIGLISVVFYCSFLHTVGTAQINELVVTSAARGRGVGRALVDAAISEARARGMDEVEVSTASDNAAAIRFYQRAGFDQQHVLLGMDLED